MNINHLFFNELWQCKRNLMEIFRKVNSSTQSHFCNISIDCEMGRVIDLASIIFFVFFFKAFGIDIMCSISYPLSYRVNTIHCCFFALNIYFLKQKIVIFFEIWTNCCLRLFSFVNELCFRWIFCLRKGHAVTASISAFWIKGFVDGLT